jgi:DNA invertase Pin-like site-specific DNA recombinase
MNCPGMVALLAFMDAQPSEKFMVVFGDLKRFARDTEFHLKLSRAIKMRNATRECLNFRFEDSPEGEFIETILAAQGELEREQNRRQTIQKMTARLEQGFWAFQAPAGYRYQKSKHGGKELVRDEPYATIMQQALEGYASGLFDTQAEVKRFWKASRIFRDVHQMA